MEVTNVRRSGSSTVIALKMIALALEHPDLAIEIKDHHPTHAADNHLAHLIRDLLERLGFIGFNITKRGTEFYLEFKRPVVPWRSK